MIEIMSAKTQCVSKTYLNIFFGFVFISFDIYLDCDNKMKWNKFAFTNYLIFIWKFLNLFTHFGVTDVLQFHVWVFVQHFVFIYVCLICRSTWKRKRKKRRKHETITYGTAWQSDPISFLIHTIRSNSSIRYSLCLPSNICVDIVIGYDQ